jgi:hypothetical protein
MSEENKPEKKKSRNRPTRLALMDILGRIRRLTIEGYSRREITQMLNLPERTFDRYMATIYKNDLRFFEEQGKQTLATEINVFKERILKDYRYFISMSENPKMTPNIRLDARRSAVDLSLGLVILEREAPQVILKEFGKRFYSGGSNNNIKSFSPSYDEMYAPSSSWMKEKDQKSEKEEGENRD